jgi:signal transduction histidine kinase
MRSLLVDIYPPNLATEGLAAALTDLADTVERDGVQVELELADVDGLPLPVSSVLFRAAQEILRNVLAHSRSRQVSVRLSRAAGRTVLAIDDDGQGFEESALPERRREGHVGLRSLGDLVRDSGGRLTVRSAPGQGTRVEVEMPE